MDETSLKFAQDVLSLVDKLMVAVVAIVASVITQWLDHNWSKEREQDKLLQEKAERLVLEIYALQEWTDRLYRMLLSQNKERIDLKPVRRIVALSLLYFPSLEKEHKTLVHHLSNLESFAKRPHEMPNLKRWEELYDAYLDASFRCIESIRVQVKRRP
jgi:hypothetical protein